MGWLKLTKRNRLSEVLGQGSIDSKGEEPIYFAPCVNNHRAQERQRVEQALRESEEQYRRLVQDSSDAILIARGNKIVFVNHTGATLLGAGTAEQLIHRCPLDFFPPDHDRIAFSTIRHAIEQHDSLPSLEYQIMRLDQSSMDVEILASPLMFEGSTACQLVLRDIGRRKQLEQQLYHAQKMEAIGQLAGGVAHDFNNMLMIINGHTSLLLLDSSTLDSDQIRSVEQIQQAGTRAAGLTSQLLAFSRRQLLHPKVLDLHTILRRTQDMLVPLLGESIELVFSLEASLTRMKADPCQVEQSLVNLVVNARDAMPQGGRLTIRTINISLQSALAGIEEDIPPGNYILLIISDTGTGMDARTKRHLFEPFFTTKPRGKGTGLGLSTVYGVVKQSDGFIHVESEPGHGATITLYFPLVMDPLDAEPQDTNSDEQPMEGHETVLVAEDEPDLRAIICDTLRLNGYGVLVARHGIEALLVARQHLGPIHLLLADVVMPQMSGRELAESLVAARTEMKVMYMSGYTSDAVLHRGVVAQGTNFLQKPFTISTLLRTIRRTLADRHALSSHNQVRPPHTKKEQHGTA